MIRLATDVEAFAKEQAEVIEAVEKALLGPAKTALEHYGESGWYSALLDRSEKALRDRFRQESGHQRSPTLSLALLSFRRQAEKAMKHTKEPPEGSIESRAAALAASLATSVVNAALVAAARSLGASGLVKVWHSMEDERVRPTHAAANGQKVPIGRTFTVGGAKMNRPGDLRAPVEEWINCRCILGLQTAEGEDALVAAGDTSTSVGIFLLPADADPIRAISSEEAHVTTIWLGDMDEIDVSLGEIVDDVRSVAAEFEPITVQVKARGTLGDEDADVAFLDRPTLEPIREALLGHETIREQMESVEQFPEWTPHVTLGYPDTPANEPDADLPDSITLDRVAVWIGNTHHDYMLGEAMTRKNVTAAAEDEFPAPSEPLDIVEQVQWWGVLAPENVLSGDRRKFGQDALRWRDPPLPLAWQKQNQPAHDSSVVVARIDRIWRKNGLVYGTGPWSSSAEADEAIAQVADMMMRGISIDADDGTMVLEMRDGTPLEEYLAANDELPPEEEVITVFPSARISGATICAIPAFAQAFIALGPPPPDVLPDDEPEAEQIVEEEPVLASDEEVLIAVVDAETGEVTEFKEYDAEQRRKMADNGTAMPDGSFPIADVEDLENAIQSIGRAKDPAAAKAFIKKRAKALGAEGKIPEDWSVETVVATAEEVGSNEVFVKTEDGPGWLTHPVDTDRLRDYWVRGPGAAKINWGVPGDFNRCRANLAKYVKPQHLSGYCANRHYDALGFWPGRPLSADTIRAAGEPTAPGIHLVAAASIPDAPPKEWFSDPGLVAPTPVTITEEGRVFGHVAQWGVCHIGIPGTCVTAPNSATNYAYFMTGVVPTAEGEYVPVGQITMGTGHADIHDGARVAAAHYDNTGFAIADIAVGEDEIGIWFSGALRPGVTEQQVRELAAAGNLSGDWRWIPATGSKEMVAALAVNVGGFPIPRTTIAASGGVQTALVAAGIVARPKQPASEDIEQIVRKVFREEQERIAAAAELKRLAESGKVPSPKQRLQRLAESRKR